MPKEEKTVYITAKYRGQPIEIVDECKESERTTMVNEYRMAFGQDCQVSSTMKPAAKLLAEWED